MTGRWKKIKVPLIVSFFQNGKKNNNKAFISIKMLLFLETIMASCANVSATRVSFCLRSFSGSLVFTPKTPESVFGQCHAKH